jgi:hypothetical protein
LWDGRINKEQKRRAKKHKISNAGVVVISEIWSAVTWRAFFVSTFDFGKKDFE